MIRVLLDSISSETLEWLQRGLHADAFELNMVSLTENFTEAVREIRPHIAVLDRIHERQGETKQRIEILKCVRADVRIIAISEDSSIDDASVIERGVFYYMTSKDATELKRIIEAAATALARTDDHSVHIPERE